MATRKPTQPSDAEIEKQDPSGVNAAREERADLIEQANKADAETAKAEQAAADAASRPVKTPKKTRDSSGRPAIRTAERRTAPRHVVKRDDAGAAEQQRAARENSAETQLGDFDGPPVVAPIIEPLKGGSFEVVRGDGSGDKVTESVQRLFDGRVWGTGYVAPGEVIIDVRKEDGQDHQRFSTYSYDGTVDFSLGGILNSPGTWLIHLEQPVTQVGEGRDDHLPVVREGKATKVTII